MTERVHRYISATLDYSVTKIEDAAGFLGEILVCLKSQSFPVLEKIRLFIILL